MSYSGANRPARRARHVANKPVPEHVRNPDNTWHYLKVGGVANVDHSRVGWRKPKVGHIHAVGLRGPPKSNRRRERARPSDKHYNFHYTHQDARAITKVADRLLDGVGELHHRKAVLLAPAWRLRVIFVLLCCAILTQRPVFVCGGRCPFASAVSGRCSVASVSNASRRRSRRGCAS